MPSLSPLSSLVKSLMRFFFFFLFCFVLFCFFELVEFYIPVRKHCKRQASRKKDQKKLRTVPLVFFSRAGATTKYPANLKRHPRNTCIVYHYQTLAASFVVVCLSGFCLARLYFFLSGEGGGGVVIYCLKFVIKGVPGCSGPAPDFTDTQTYM